MQKNLTDVRIKALKGRKQRYEIWGPGGLGVRVSPAGRRSFIFMYRYGGRARRLTLGSYPLMTLGAANAAHGNARRLLELGIDPGSKLVDERLSERQAPTLEDLAAAYLEIHAARKKKASSYAADKRMLAHDVLPVLGRRKAKDVTRREIIALVENIYTRAPIMANRVLALIRRVYNFEIERDIVQSTPCVQIKPPAKENSRARVLSESEIQILWTALDNVDALRPVRQAMKLVLVTAQRKGEVVTARRDEIEGRWWTIPAEKSKNGLPHRVWLSDLAVEVIPGDSEWLFPAPRGGHIRADSVNKMMQRHNLGVTNFTPHDLRRTAASNMSGLGVRRVVLKNPAMA